MADELIVFVTAPNGEESNLLAEALVAEQLAACVNLVRGVESVYRWEGKVVKESETLLIIKTVRPVYDQLEKRVRELHSYTTPEVVAVSIERGSADYLSWLARATSKSS
jgi:periplasmic divalent cation tolerance protein